MIALARKLPLWCWGFGLLLAVIVYLRIENAALHGAQGAARDAQFKSAIDAIHAGRADEEDGKAVDRRKLDALMTEIARNREELRLLADRSRASGEATAKDKQAAVDLAAHPDLDAARKAVAPLGVKILAIPRPTP